MQDDKVVEGKVRLARILGERMGKAFCAAFFHVGDGCGDGFLCLGEGA